MFENKMLVYYGSYNLKYWLELIINEDICLPPYQRNFVWNPNMVIELYNTLSKNYYVPPVLIANYSSERKNLILDGQQRLSSILLCFLGIYPKNNITQSDDSFVIRWNMSEIVKIIKEKYRGREIFDNRDKIRKDIIDTNRYISIDEKEFLNECQDKNLSKKILLFNDKKLYEDVLLGYSYTKFNKPNEQDERIAYANIFKTINTSGKTLSPMESRRSLYWIGKNSCINEQFFEPDFAKSIFIQDKQLDFTELLSYVAEFNFTDNYNVAVGYKIVEKREKYFEDFIDTVLLSQIDDINKGNKNSIFGNIYQTMSYNVNDNIDSIKKNIKERFIKMEELYKYIKKENKNEDETYKNRVEPQIYFFGAIHFIIFKGKEIKLCNQLIDELNAITKDITTNAQNKKGRVEYNTLSSIRDRLKKSIEVYKKYVF